MRRVSVKEAVKVTLHRVGLYRGTARFANAVLGRDHDRRRLLAFYRPLIAPGHLVFDVGANHGGYAEVFAALGARVVAVEPNPACVREIRMRCPASVTVVETAVGATVGTATLKMVSDSGYSTLSSLSDSWVTTAQEAPRFRGLVWGRELAVPVTTLDALRATYGEPDYIKIDIEGYEEEALHGLSRQPPLLSLEYNAEALASLQQCINHRVIAPDSTFNYVVGSGVALEAPSWVDRASFGRYVERLPRETFGDVFVRRPVGRP